jgi:hypothetical protein
MAKVLAKRRETLPYVSIACAVEKLLVEADHVASAIRIVDRLFVPQEEMEKFKQGELIGMPIRLFICLKAGDFRGKCSLSLYQISPSGQRERDPVGTTNEMAFDGPNISFDFGYNIAAPAAFYWRGPGLYLFEVMSQNKVLSKICISLAPPPPAGSMKE